jgi:hypothetical protein
MRNLHHETGPTDSVYKRFFVGLIEKSDLRRFEKVIQQIIRNKQLMAKGTNVTGKGTICLGFCIHTVIAYLIYR